MDDVFLVSFPRSGNTWLSFILANIMVEKLGLDIEVNHFNIHGFIPDIHMGRDIPLDMGFFPFKRIIKSHSDFNPQYKNVIYILRDPRNVMVSYYKFMIGLGWFDGDISEFIREEKHGISAWAAHVNGWLDNITPGMRFRIFQYEDFKSNIEESTRALARLVGVILSDDTLERIVQNTSFEYMQKLEEDTGSLAVKKHYKDFKFVRDGDNRGWKNELGEEDLFYIRNVAGRLMKKYGYDLERERRNVIAQ